MRRVLSVLAGLLAAGLLWEGYKAVGNPEGTVLFGVRVLPRADDLSMPHLWTVADRLGSPELAGGRPVWQVVLDACVFTLGITAAGFLAGALIGLVLAVAMQRFRIVERGLLPYVILSQTVPLVALAPLIAGWGGVLMPPWATVAVIAAYLAFFPVAVGMLRGLQSPSASGAELMRSYAAGWWRTLVKLRFPAALPYLFPALRLAGAAAVVGAVVGEISTGTRGGIGRLIIEYSREATSDPAKVYTAMLGAALLGLLVAGAVSLLELPLMRHRRHVEVVTL
ncbi:putative ABC transporter permease protein [Actinoplanes missouriensis 431]|uniref:Putative ABC transporter permease protein n=1 Tax=Actinoplanes missouriensis (strain ATCC 14538 / DSM 43046 / CBS 188.64 / JCM 3121 / NBRC 102363 / NCIMB 12654 / NRRL B-3342 / UNCC 431) TaxID=512565 RepID=I0HCH2_ACTM4|nr:ABC transporter permease subunit [Actinoplanes missouriensis]BAL90709.1 putative ABC transporter permease protein [Actinoplanes missouriensis 431]